LLVLFTAALFLGCETPTQTNIAPPPANTAVNTAPPPAAPAPPVETATGPFTLPMLNALLEDEEFLKEAKSSLNLTDEELNKLRSAANESTSGLDEENYTEGSSRQISEKSRAAVNQILGNDRGGRLIALAQQKFTGTEPAGGAAAGSVPTDTRILVNIPAFRMDVIKDGKIVKTYKIGIGYPEFPLPTGLRQAKEIIFNPTWTPPDEPWVKGKVKPLEKVEAGSKLNPLGPIKIPIGLPSLIHGGKSPARIGTFASHGCIGLTNGQVQDFALELSSLAGNDLTQQQVKEYEKQKTETKNVKLGRDIPVEIRYETIVVENGTLKIYRDVYERGTNTQENLEKVLSAHGLSFSQLDPNTQKGITAALEEMQLDATGNPSDAPTNSNSNTNDNPSTKNTNSNSKSNTNGNTNSGKVTRNIKGRKEASFQIPQLAGKGYPAPVKLKAS
jgi:lipoprotein-anchoring transpeptidase ErfK/SrfK